MFEKLSSSSEQNYGSLKRVGLGAGRLLNPQYDPKRGKMTAAEDLVKAWLTHRPALCDVVVSCMRKPLNLRSSGQYGAEEL